MAELKPCPFCGAKMNLFPGGRLFAWHEENCFFQLLEEREVGMTGEEIIEEFIKAWNRRVDNG